MADEEPDIIASLRKTIVDLEHRHKVEAALKAEEYKIEIGRVVKTYQSKLNFLKSDPDAICEGEDVQFVLDNGEKLRSLRYVLTTKSSHFKEIFKKNDAAGHSRVYRLKETSFAIISAVIGFCHTGDITFTEEVTARKVLNFANLFRIDYLEEVCMEELIKSRYKENTQDTSSPILCAVIGFCNTGEINFTDEITPLQVLKVAHDHKISTLEEVCLKESMKTIFSKDASKASSSSKSPQGNEEETSNEDEEEEEEEESNEKPAHNRSGGGFLEKDRFEIGLESTKRIHSLEVEAQSLSKKVKIEASCDWGSENGTLRSDADPNPLSNFNISKALTKSLKSRGIETLLPIQAATFKSILAGNDVVARVSPCQSTTLSFVLPILESLKRKGRNDKKLGRAPSVLVLTRTVDIAVQLYSDFNFYGDPLGLETLVAQGGARHIHHTNLMLSSGVDIVIGTPERFRAMKVHNVNLNLKALMFLVLENPYWDKDVEAILKATQDASRVQTLLFGESIFAKELEIMKRFMNPGKTMMHLVRDEKSKASGNVKHYFMPCRYQTRTLLSADLIGDTISCHGKVESVLYSPKVLEVLESLHFTAPHASRSQGVQPAENTAKN